MKKTSGPIRSCKPDFVRRRMPAVWSFFSRGMLKHPARPFVLRWHFPSGNPWEVPVSRFHGTRCLVMSGLSSIPVRKPEQRPPGPDRHGLHTLSGRPGKAQRKNRGIFQRRPFRAWRPFSAPSRFPEIPSGRPSRKIVSIFHRKGRNSRIPAYPESVRTSPSPGRTWRESVLHQPLQTQLPLLLGRNAGIPVKRTEKAATGCLP